MPYQHALLALASSGERRLLLITGSQTWTQEQATGLQTNNTILFSDPTIVAHALPTTRVTRQLGQEYDRVIYDGYAGLHPDMLAASAGLVRAGGLLIILMPESGHWLRFDDPDYQRYVPEPHQRHRCHHHFLNRLQRLISRAAGVWCYDQQRGWSGLDTPVAQVWQHSADALGCLTRCQRRAVDAIQHTASGHRHRPLIVTADRGRGKSAALGIAAGHLLRQAHRGARMRILVTAPSLSTLATVIRHAEQVTGCLWQNDRLSLPDAELCFMSPERLITERPRCELLLIDEAAAIPGQQLAALTTHYSRLVFATTRHGYEGSGQGFALRIQRRLEQQYAHLEICQLHEPIRWAPTDPLEPLINRLFLLDVDLPVPPVLGESDIQYRWVDQAALVEDESLLRQIYGLLVLAHYQTSLSDLRALLDTPGLHILIQTLDETLIGVLLLNEEGPLDDGLAEKVWLGERRVRGELLPQSLISHAGLREAGQYRYGRIMRIAIHPLCQQRGLGSRLVATLQQQAARWDYIGVAFAASVSLLRFWLHAGFTPLRLGLHPDTASGEVSILMLNTIDAQRHSALQQWHATFLADLPTFLPRQLSQLDPECVAVLLANATIASLSSTDNERVRSVANSLHPLDHALPSIQRWLLGHGSALSVLTTADLQLLIRRIWQGWEWAALQQAGLVSGQKAGQQRIRQILTQLLSYAGG